MAASQKTLVVIGRGLAGNLAALALSNSLGASWRIVQVGQPDNDQRQPPAHTRSDHVARQNVSRDADGHANPDGGQIPSVPGSALRGDRGQILTVKRRSGMILLQLNDFPSVVLRHGAKI